MLSEAYECAKRGAELLDTQRPGWRDAISLERLDVRLCHSCVIGQIYGDYASWVYEVVEDDEDPAHYGFDTWDGGDPVESGDGDPSPEYDALNAAWRLVVAGLPA
jgi:hypothetical protein